MGITFSGGVYGLFSANINDFLFAKEEIEKEEDEEGKKQKKTAKMEENVFFLFFFFLISHKSKLKAYFMPNLTMFHSSFMVTFNVRHQFQFGPSMSYASQSLRFAFILVFWGSYV